MKKQPGGPLPKEVQRRIMNLCSQGEKTCVVVMRNGKPTRVFRLDQYLKMRELPHEVKPWEHRKLNDLVPDPLGAVDGKVLSSLSRQEIYDE